MSRQETWVNSELSDQFELKVGVTSGMSFTAFFAVVVYATELARDGMSKDLLYADDLVLIIKTTEGLRNVFK